MRQWLRFVAIGLVLGLFTEVHFQLIIRNNPSGFISALFLYPVILTLAYAAHTFINRLVPSTWKGDVLHYMACGIAGLGVEWVLLGNGPESNASQLGMFAMWTTFCFGPRLLTRNLPLIQEARQKFWLTFGFVAVLLTTIVLLINDSQAKIVVAALGLSGTNIVWSGWLLLLAWQARQKRIREYVEAA